MLVKLRNSLFVDTLNLKLLRLNNSGAVEGQIDLSQGDENSNDNKPIKEISPRFITTYETEENIYVLFYNPKYTSPHVSISFEDKIQLLVIKKNDWSVRKYKFSNILGSDLTSVLTGSRYVEDYFVEFLGVFEKKGTPEKTFVSLIVRADYKDGGDARLGKIAVIELPLGQQATISTPATFNNTSISGSYNVVNNLNTLYTITIFTQLTTNNVLQILNNMFARISNTIYVRNFSAPGVEKYRIEYDVKEVAPTNTYNIISLSQMIESFNDAEISSNFRNVYPRGEGEVVECTNTLSNWQSSVVASVNTQTETVTYDNKNYKIFNILLYRSDTPPSTAPQNSILYRTIKAPSGTQILPYNSILTVKMTTSNINNLKWGAYATIYQVQRARHQNNLNLLILDKTVRWVSYTQDVDILIKEGAQEVIVVLNNPHDYVELPVLESAFQNLSDERKTRAINSSATWGETDTMFEIRYKIKEQNFSVKNRINKVDENGVTVFDRTTTQVQGAVVTTIDLIENTLGGQIRGFKRVYEIERRSATPRFVSGQAYRGVYNLNGTIRIPRARLQEANLNATSRFYIFRLRVNNTPLNTSGIVLEPQGVLQISGGEITINPQGMQNVTNRVIRIKDIDIILSSPNQTRHIRHNIDYTSYENTNIRPTFADIGNYLNLNLVFLEDVINSTYDEMVIKVRFEIIYIYNGTNVIYNAEGVDYVYSVDNTNNQKISVAIERDAELGDESNFIRPEKRSELYYYATNTKVLFLRNSFMSPIVIKRLEIDRPYATNVKEVALGGETLLMLYRKRGYVYFYLNKKVTERVGVDGGTRVFVRQQNEYTPSLTVSDAIYDQSLNMFVFDYGANGLALTEIYGANNSEDRNVLETQVFAFDLVNIEPNKAITLVRSRGANNNTIIEIRRSSGNNITLTTTARAFAHYSSGDETIQRVNNISISLPDKIEVMLRRLLMREKGMQAINITTESEVEMSSLISSPQPYHVINTRFLNSINNLITLITIRREGDTILRLLIPSNTVLFENTRSIKSSIRESVSSATGIAVNEYPIQTLWTADINIANTLWNTTNLNNEFNTLSGRTVYGSNFPIAYTFSENAGVKNLELTGYWVTQNIVPLIFLHKLGILKSGNIVAYTVYLDNINNPNTSKIYRQILSKVVINGLPANRIQINGGIRLSHLQVTYTNRSLGDVNRTRNRIIERKYAI